MNRYPATRQPTRHLVLIAPNQYTLFGGETIHPPTRPALPQARLVGQVPVNTKPAQLPDKPIDPEPHSRFRLDAEITAPTGQTARLRANLLAIETLKQIERENRPATDVEKQQLARYAGWGGLSALWKADCYADWQADRNTSNEATQRWATRYGPARLRLAQLLTPAEQTAAEASTLNAFYTAPLVVAEMWRAVQQLGFTGGRILEPAAGVGCFVGLMPDTTRERSAWVAVEKDVLSARILAALYPDVTTLNTGLEQTNWADNGFDLVIGNVPFGGYSVYDKRHPELNQWPIHNYFIGRAVQLVKSGGLVALITSAGTLDAAGRDFRQYLTTQAGAELAGAIRLPANTVEGNGGTQVTTDILFLRKREGLTKCFPAHAFERTVTIHTEATDPDETGDAVRTLAVNEYYHARPEQMLGQMTFADRVGQGGLYRADQPTLHDDDPATFPARLAQAVTRLPAGCYGPSDQTNQPTDRAELARTAPTQTEERFSESVTIKGRRYSQRVIITQYDRLRTTFAELRKAEQDNAPDCQLDNLRIDLNQAYSLFVRCFGTLNRNRAVAFLEDYDPQFALVQALEIVTRTERGATICKADIFTRRVYPASTCPDRVESLTDALRLSVALFGTIRLDAVSRWTGRDEADTERALLAQELVFRNPATGRLDDRDSYLSGDVRRKLAQATEAASREPAYTVNERALSGVVPTTVPAAAVQFRLGSVWIPARIIEAFIRHILQTDAVRVSYNQRAGQYEIDGAGNVGTVQNRSLGTSRRTALQLIEAALQQRTVQITKTIIDGEGEERQVKDLEATSQAVQAQEQLNEAFIEYVREQHSPTLETVYNELYNSYRHKTYREPALAHYPGASPAVRLRFHQFRAVERIKEQDTLLAHAVGSGKSYTMIAAAMELKRLGLAHKPLIVVQNSTLNDFARSWRTLYPAAVIYVPQPADLQAANRKRFLQRIATNNFDGVLIPQSFLKLIPDDPASEEAVIQEEIERVAYMVAAAARQGKQKPMTVKRLNELKLRLATRRQRQADRQKDDMLTFNQLGIDALFLDECFPAQTPVLTDEGWLTIGEIVEKRMKVNVLTFNEKERSFEYKPVINWLKKPLVKRLVQVRHGKGAFVCTEDHKIWTIENGYVKAQDLTSVHTLIITTLPGLPATNSEPPAMSVLLNGMCDKAQTQTNGCQRLQMEQASSLQANRPDAPLRVVSDQPRQKSAQTVLRYVLRGFLPKLITTHSGAEAAAWTNGVGRRRAKSRCTGEKSECQFRAHETKEPHVQPGNGTEDDPGIAGTYVSCQRRKRQTDRTAKKALSGSELAGGKYGVGDSDYAGTGSVSVFTQSLQGRHCRSRPETGYRGGWKKPRDQKVEVFGQTENGNFGSVRVEGVTIYERASDGRIGFSDTAVNHVYDLTVANNHNYFAAGILVSNCHKYKRLGFFTLRQNVKGIDAAGSEDALSALFKCRSVQARQGRVVLATGTPISNTMAEAWTTLRFIAPQRLEKAMLTTFDQFAGAFGTVIQSFELTATGNFKAIERFARFVNVQQLSELYRAHVDVVLNDDIVEFQQAVTGGRSVLPMLKDNAHTRLILPQTEGVADELDRIKETLGWFENLTGAEKRDHSYIPLVCFGQARKATLDIRLLDPTAPDEAGSKSNRAVAEIHRIYTATADYRGTQLVFADNYQSPAIRQTVTALTDDGLADQLTEPNPVASRFNPFADIRAKLIAEGIPACEIAVVPAEADKREPLFAKVRMGAVRVLLGTSERMGVGVNVQERLAAVHHLDAPNRPTDFEQRNGRLIRQGNLHAEWGISVEVLTYGVERTLDATAYGRLAVKQKFINQVLKGHIADDQISDISADDDFSAMSFDQMMATLSGSQYALLYTTRQLELSRLVQARRNWQRGLMDAQAQVERAETFLRHSETEQRQLQEEAATLTDHFGTPYAVTSVTIGNVTYTEKMGEVVQRLLEQVKAAVKRHDSKPETLLVNGLPLTLTGERSVELVGDLLPGQPVVRYAWGNLSGVVSSANGLFLSLKAAVSRVGQAPAQLAHEQQRARLILEEYGRKLTQPFRQEADLHRLETEVADLKHRMETEGQPEPVAESSLES